MINLQSIKQGAQLRAPRIVLLGVEKIGKSTFAAGADRPIFLPIRQEEGVDDLDVAKFPTLQNFNQVREALGTLAKEDHDFKTVVIDSASALEPIIYGDVCETEKAASIEKVGGGYGKGYTEALSRWRELMQALDYLREHKGMASVIIGHVKVKKFDDPLNESYDQFQFDVNDKASCRAVSLGGLYRIREHQNLCEEGASGIRRREGQSTRFGQRPAFSILPKVTGISCGRPWAIWPATIRPAT